MNKIPSKVTLLPFHQSACTAILSQSPKRPSSLLPPAAPGFTRPPLCAEEAALRRALEHADGDHSSLIQVYEAFIQSEWPTLHPLKRIPDFPKRGGGVQQLTDLYAQEVEALWPRVGFFQRFLGL